ncbi:hypothetical protein [Paenibacillus xylanilyticus]|uniref:Uncharacterized protein n=1 Tax=Paenibacillus xylanilyticus TaxID=248903 RepID=A0A7Y6EZ44_9BACL|nr:hypothetical protein [Paenibacillus xylanilyticus]NUU79225.1 hypothetical protein [Paenibacillus xylanilyticus]
MRIAKRIGIMSSMGSMILWVILILFNPYTHERAENDVIISTLFSLFIPACLAWLASIIQKPSLMFIAFFWSLPISLYMTMTPSVFKWFGVTSIMYLISGILIIRGIRSRLKRIN